MFCSVVFDLRVWPTSTASMTIPPCHRIHSAPVPLLDLPHAPMGFDVVNPCCVPHVNYPTCLAALLWAVPHMRLLAFTASLLMAGAAGRAADGTQAPLLGMHTRTPYPS